MVEIIFKIQFLRYQTQISSHQARCKSTIWEFILILRDFFSWVEKFSAGREFFSPVENNCFCRSRIFYPSKSFWPIESLFKWSRFLLVCRQAGRKFFVGSGRFPTKTYHVVQTTWRLSDGNSAGNMFRQILGRIGDLSAAFDQRQACADSQCSFCGCIALSKPSNCSFALTSMSFRDLPLL